MLEQGKVMDLFIPDIFELVTKELTQFDVIALSRTCSAINVLANNVLYRSITIDCNFSQFEKEYSGKKTTFIRSKSNFSSFIRAVRKSENNLCKWNIIKELHVINLPPDFYDFEMCLLGLSNEALPILEKAAFDVLSINNSLSFNVLKHLLNNEYSRRTLSVLNFDLNVHAPTKSFYDIIYDSKMRFTNLKTLSMRHIRRDFNIVDILRLIHDDSVNKLENLELAFQHKTFKLTDLLELAAKLKPNNALFDEISKFKYLKRLSLRSMTIDQTMLQNSKMENLIALQGITHLELCDVRIINPCAPKSLMDTLYEKIPCCSLKSVKVDIRSTSDDYVPDFFLNRVSRNQLAEIDIVIRYNGMYLKSLDEIINEYVRMILFHRSSLEKLSIEIKSEKNLVNTNEQLHKEQLLELISHRFKNLKSLRIQVFADCVVMYKNLIFKNMPKLENLWIVGSNAVPIHFGSGNMYPGIYDKWWRLIYLPEALTNGIHKHPLTYIKIDECLFYISTEENDRVQPKDSIDNLFDLKTRVFLTN